MKSIKIILSALLVVTTIVAINAIHTTRYDESMEGVEKTISWEMVNLRESYSTNSKVIDSLDLGANVTLTGYSYEYFGGNGSSEETWTQVKLSDGTVGWLVTASIR